MNRSRIIRWSVAIVLLLFVSALAWEKSGDFSDLPLAALNYYWAIPLILAKLAVAVIAGTRLAATVNIFGVRLVPREWLGLASISTLAGYTAPAKMGSLIRIAYLRRIHSMSINDQLTSMAGASFIDFAASAVICLVIISIQIIGGRTPATTLITGISLAFLAGFTGLLILQTLGKHNPGKQAGLTGRLIFKASESARIFTSDHGGFTWLVILTFGSIALKTVALLLCFKLAGEGTDWTVIMLVAALINVVALLALTPGNLGITEGAIVGLLAAGGVDFQAAAVIALLSRVFSMIVQFPLGFVYALILFGGFNRALQSGKEQDAAGI